MYSIHFRIDAVGRTHFRIYLPGSMTNPMHLKIQATQIIELILPVFFHLPSPAPCVGSPSEKTTTLVLISQTLFSLKFKYITTSE